MKPPIVREGDRERLQQTQRERLLLRRKRQPGSRGEDEDAIKKLFTPEFRNRLDATIGFAGLTPEIVGRVVEKFVMQLEAQLADRNVTIEASSAAKEWLAERGYDRLYGARPLARVIQEYIKKPLADEVLFGRLKSGGHVRVVVTTGEDGKTKLGFEYPDGPVTPRPEKLPEPRRAKKRRSSPRRKPPGGGPGGNSPPRRGSVPKVPLVKV